MNITIADKPFPESGAIAVFSAAKKTLSPSAKALDKITKGALSRALKNANFSGSKGEILELISPGNGKLTRLVLVGVGDPENLTQRTVEEIGGAIAARLQTSGEKQLAVVVDRIKGSPVPEGAFAAHLASGLLIRSYRFDKYRTKEANKKKPSLKTVRILSHQSKQAKVIFAVAKKVISGVFLTRDLTSEPPNVVYPKSFAKIIKSLEADGLKVEILGEAALRKIGMRALLGVGQGSNFESQVVVMRWNGVPKAKMTKPVALIGKGVTFDTGGISIKPAEGMDLMKWDMGGAGIVVGAMKALAKRKAKANVVGIVGLVENMPSGTAQRPGDVVESLSGQTIEILNTDAEGRLVLADVLWYCQQKYKPQVMIDLATLTGAIIVTLGYDQYAGYFTDDDKIAEQLDAAGKITGDLVWRLPLSENYDKLINSQIADMQNIGGKGAGSITAAQFLKRFTNGVPWAHIDVAGVVWSAANKPLWEKGATGYGVRLLDRFVADNYEI